jgi:cytochrome P450
MQIDYDPFEPSGAASYAQFRLLREHAPVYEVRPRTWVVARYEDVRFVLKSPGLFSSDAMASAMLGFEPGVDPSSDPESLEYLSGLARSMPIGGPGNQTRMLILSDPPDHTTLRAIVNRGFTPRRIAAWEARLREIVAEAMERLHRGEEFDVVRDFAIPVPVTVISEMLGVEPEKQLDFKRWSDGIIAGVSGPGRKLGLEASGFTAAMRSLTDYIGEIAAARRREPRDDLLSVLVEAQGGESGLTANEVVMFVVLLLVAGNETTTNLIGNAVNALLDHPEQLALLRDHPEKVPALVEETLRYESPVQLLFRRATEPVEVGGARIGANDYVVPLLGSANRDDRQFPDGDRFDLRRDAQGHLAFGFGQHFCLGASLARLEARCALEALVPELPGLARSEPDVCYIESFQMRGPSRLPLARVA